MVIKRIVTGFDTIGPLIGFQRMLASNRGCRCKVWLTAMKNEVGSIVNEHGSSNKLFQFILLSQSMRQSAEDGRYVLVA